MNYREFVQGASCGRRAGLLRLRRADRPIEFKCLEADCGLCCEVLGSHINLEPDEAEALAGDWIQNTQQGEKILRAEEGCCALYKSGLCRRYESRPSQCREYPWYNVGGKLYYDSGCPGIRKGRDSRPSLTLIKPIERMFLGVPLLLRHILLALMKVW